MEYETVAFLLMLAAIDEDMPKKTNIRGPTRGWIRRRQTKGCFNHLNMELRSEDPLSYRRWLRINVTMFDELLLLLGSALEKKTTRCQEPIPPAERLTIALRFLATGQSFRSLSWEFRVGERTVSYIVTETCTALYKALLHTFQYPNKKSDWEAIAKQFNDRWNFPQCLGAIDGKHVVLKKPSLSGSHFHNYKGTESIVLLAIVDADYIFRYIDVGTQGRISDGGVWNKCSFKQLLDVDKIDLPEPQVLPGRVTPVPYVFITDDAFALQTYLLKPYGGTNESLEQRVYDYRLSRARRMVESAFGILANRFRVFLQPICLSPVKAKQIIFATCALHNYLRSKGNVECWPMDMTDREDIDSGSIVPGRWHSELPGTQITGLNMPNIRTNYSHNYGMAARSVRDEYKDYFNSETGAVHWQLRFA